MPRKPGHRPAEVRSDRAAIPKPIRCVPICHSGTSRNPKAHLPPTSSPTDPPTPNDRNDKEPNPPQRPWDTRSDRNRRPPPNDRKRPGRHSQANLDLHTFSMMKTRDAGLALHSIRRNHPERAGESLQSGSDLAQSDETPRRGVEAFTPPHRKVECRLAPLIHARAQERDLASQKAGSGDTRGRIILAGR